MRWTVYLEGGPRRVNHAAVAIGNRIYSFGGYCSDEISRKEPIDVHVLNIETYRWQKVTSADSRKRKAAVLKSLNNNTIKSNELSSTVADQQQPTTSTVLSHPRRRSVADLHPLSQLRHFRPPIDDAQSIVFQRRRAATVDSGDIANNIHRPVPDLQVQINDADLRNNNQLAYDLDAMDVELSNDDDLISEADEFDNFEDDDDDDINFDGDGEDYDDFDFNYHNFVNSDDGGHPRRRRRLNSLLVPNNLLVSNPNDAQLSTRLSSEVPYQRYGHTVVAYNYKAYLWGGRSDDFGTSSVLHEFDPLTQKWTIVKCNGGTVPPSRDGHTAVVYGDSMYIFGGFEEQFHRFSQETFAYHFPTGTWQLLKTENEPPQHRDFHTACVLDGKMYVFGGRSDEAGQHHSSKDKYCDELKCLDLKRLCWSTVETKGCAPCGRRSHSVWVYNEKMYIFGGYSSIGDLHFNDLREFNPKKSEWRLVKPSHGVESAPAPRRRQCTVVVGHKVFLFGGTMPYQTKKSNRSLIDLSDLYVLDFQPSLASLCSGALISYGLNERYDHLLPLVLRREIRYMYMPNSISKSSKSRIGCSNG